MERFWDNHKLLYNTLLLRFYNGVLETLAYTPQQILQSIETLRPHYSHTRHSPSITYYPNKNPWDSTPQESLRLHTVLLRFWTSLRLYTLLHIQNKQETPPHTTPQESLILYSSTVEPHHTTPLLIDSSSLYPHANPRIILPYCPQDYSHWKSTTPHTGWNGGSLQYCRNSGRTWECLGNASSI